MCRRRCPNIQQVFFGASGSPSVLIVSLTAPPMLLFRALSAVLMLPLLVVAAMAVFWYRESLPEYSCQVVYPSTENDYASTQETDQMEHPSELNRVLKALVRACLTAVPPRRVLAVRHLCMHKVGY
jgi:hypothetical protein